MAKIEQMGRGRTLTITGAVGVQGLNKLLRDFKKLDKEINKTIRRVNKDIAEEVSNDAIKLGKQQTVKGRPVHRRDRGVKGIKGRARQNQASIELQGHKNNAVLSLEFGRIYQPVPKNTNKGERFRFYTQANLGKLPRSRPGAGRLYRRFVGDKAFQTGFGGYVVGKTIRNALPQIQEEYLERVFKQIKITTEMNKVVDIPIRLSTSGKTGVIKKVA
tara:strand:+ start:790 stop:1440 length:651 start_codon:yes stop_codon:yes gene_type:complete